MNKYYIGFFFKGFFETVVFTAEQLANSVIGDTDDITDFICDEDNQYHGVEFNSYIDNKMYTADFVEPKVLNIYYGDNNDENDGFIVEKDVPWVLLKVENKDSNVVYNLTDNI